jgi:hypothetical protein
LGRPIARIAGITAITAIKLFRFIKGLALSMSLRTYIDISSRYSLAPLLISSERTRRRGNLGTLNQRWRINYEEDRRSVRRSLPRTPSVNSIEREIARNKKSERQSLSHFFPFFFLSFSAINERNKKKI